MFHVCPSVWTSICIDCIEMYQPDFKMHHLAPEHLFFSQDDLLPHTNPMLVGHGRFRCALESGASFGPSLVLHAG